MVDKVPVTLAGVILMDLDGNYIPITGDITNLENITITASALPDGAATEAAQATLAASIGAPDDAARSGTGDATEISLLKAIALNTTPAP